MSKRRISTVLSQQSGPKVAKAKTTDSSSELNPGERKNWLLKSEPDTFGIMHLKQSPNQTSCWDGVRNYQARNLMKTMKIGDRGYFYHSNAGKQTGIVGEVEVVREYYPDHTALDKKGKYYDARHSEESPVWFMVDVKLVSEWDSLLSLEQLKSMKEADCPHKATLQNMMLLKKGSRLSVQPLSEEEWNCIQTLKLEIGNN